MLSLEIHVLGQVLCLLPVPWYIAHEVINGNTLISVIGQKKGCIGGTPVFI